MCLPTDSLAPTSGAEVRLVRGVDRRGHRDDDEIGLRERRRIGRHRELLGGAQVLRSTPRRSDR